MLANVRKKRRKETGKRGKETMKRGNGEEEKEGATGRGGMTDGLG